MEIKDAIHTLTFMRNGYQKLLDEGCDRGRVVGNGVEGYWKSDTPLRLVYQKHVDACDMAIESLEMLEEIEK
jgi:hypothetical protein